MTGADRIFLAVIVVVGIIAAVKIIVWLAITKVALAILAGG